MYCKYILTHKNRLVNSITLDLEYSIVLTIRFCHGTLPVWRRCGHFEYRFTVKRSEKGPRHVPGTAGGENRRCDVLKINRQWLLRGDGPMDESGEAGRSAKVLSEIYTSVKELSGEEQQFILDMIQTYIRHRRG